MKNGNTDNPVIIRTGRGPSVNGTRLTIYHIMDELKDGMTPEFVKGWYGLSDEQMAAILEYLRENKEELEEKYAEILRRAEEERRYWTERNKGRAALPGSPPADYKIAIGRAKLAAIKRERERQAGEKCESS